MGKGKQGFTASVARPPIKCECGRQFTPSAVIVHNGAGRAFKCPPCTAGEKQAKRRKKQQKDTK